MTFTEAQEIFDNAASDCKDTICPECGKYYEATSYDDDLCDSCLAVAHVHLGWLN